MSRLSVESNPLHFLLASSIMQQGDYVGFLSLFIIFSVIFHYSNWSAFPAWSDDRKTLYIYKFSLTNDYQSFSTFHPMKRLFARDTAALYVKELRSLCCLYSCRNNRLIFENIFQTFRTNGINCRKKPEQRLTLNK